MPRGIRLRNKSRHNRSPDYATLAESASLCSSHIWDLPQQIRKFQEEARNSRKAHERTLEELSELYAQQLLAQTPEQNGRSVVTQLFVDRNLAFVKLVAQRLTRQSRPVVALLATTCGQPSLIFAQAAGQPFDMGALMKEALARHGGRGGGSKDMAQGGPAKVEGLDSLLAELVTRLKD